jgi:predicted small metal-binding protein
MDQWTIECACGWTTTGSEDVVVEATQEHGRALHNMEVTREQALAMASSASR